MATQKTITRTCDFCGLDMGRTSTEAHMYHYQFASSPVEVGSLGSRRLTVRCEIHATLRVQGAGRQGQEDHLDICRSCIAGMIAQAVGLEGPSV